MINCEERNEEKEMNEFFGADFEMFSCSFVVTLEEFDSVLKSCPMPMALWRPGCRPQIGIAGA